MDAAKAFYTSVFPWQWKTEDAGGQPYDMIRLGDDMNGGAMKMEGPQWEGVPPNWSAYFAVADIEATVAKAKELGGNVINGPFEAGPGIMAIIADDIGAVFCAIQFKS
jgi:predicted enzyme related to lactoylglutathione lyase